MAAIWAMVSPRRGGGDDGEDDRRLGVDVESPLLDREQEEDEADALERDAMNNEPLLGPAAASPEKGGKGAGAGAAGADGGGGLAVNTYRQEALEQLRIAVPTCITRFFVFSSRLCSIIIVGQVLPVEKLASVSLANSVMGVFGMMVMMSFVNGLGTISNQSYGAGDLANVGYSLQCSFFLCLVLFIFPCSLIMGLAAPLLKLLGQEPAVADDAGVFLWMSMPTVVLFGCRWCLQTASMVVKVVRPFTVNAFLTCIVAITLTAVLVPRFGLLGAAAATTLYYLFNGVLDAVYSTSCSPHAGSVSRAAVRDDGSDARARLPPAEQCSSSSR